MGWKIGYDIGGTNARVCAFDDDFKPHGSKRERLREDTSSGRVAHIMAALLSALMAELAIDLDAIDAIGVGIAAQLDLDGRTVLNAPNLGWRDLDFATLLEEALPTSAPALLVNDLNALVWGEHIAGAARGSRDVLAVYVGTGVGGGVISEGRLLQGAGGKAGEIGHAKVEVGGRACGCGEHGCLEAYAGGVHLEARVHEIIATRGDLDDLLTDGEGGIHVDLLAADKRAHEVPELDALWEDAASKLALVVANACTLLNPSLLLMGGGVWENCGELRARALARLTPAILTAARRDLSIATPQLGDIAGMLGASARAASLAKQNPNAHP